MKARAQKVIKYALIIFMIGALYALFIRLTGIGIPCVFNLLTGLKCPGCGVTHMCLYLIRFDFVSAFKSNQAIFCLLPLMILTAARMIYVYIKHGKTADKPSQISIYFMIAVLLVFGVLRNIL